MTTNPEITPPMACTGCGSRWTDAELAARQAADGILSCCPERDMQPVQQSTPAPSNMRGWATMADGRRVALSEAECREIWEQADAEKAKRAEAMPDEAAALRVMHDAFTRLKELGWREAIYCPKDGSSFDVIEAGSTGIFHGYFQGEWPTGHWIVSDDRDSYVSRPILFRLDPEAEAARKAKMAEAVARFHAEEAHD